MALAHRAPNTIHIGGDITPMNEWTAGEADITPGDHIELFDNSGKMQWRKFATATNVPGSYIALEKIIHNKGIDDKYALNELVYAAKFHKGSAFLGRVVSGSNVQAGEALAANGAGTGLFKIAADSDAADGVAVFKSMQALGLIAADTRCEITVL